jgi:hypothetical protein
METAVIKHIENDQNNLAIPKAKQISPEDLRPLPTAAGKEWDSPLFSISARLPLNRLAGVGLKSNLYFTTGPLDAAQRMTCEKMYGSLRGSLGLESNKGTMNSYRIVGIFVINKARFLEPLHEKANP